MMDYPLTVRPILERARGLFGKKQIVARVGDATTRATYAELGDRVDRLAGALRTLGVAEGERVGTSSCTSRFHAAGPCCTRSTSDPS